MARTFTGLKLQGNIGKFGNEELSDVSGYADLPDGKACLPVLLVCICSLIAQDHLWLQPLCMRCLAG